MTQTAFGSPTAAPDGLAIDLRNVAKVYKGKVHALQGIEMQVRRGEVFGLLGPNGAGKSTLVKIMMTVIRPTRAEGTILGSPVGHKPTLRKVGYLPENHRFPRYLTGRQTLEFFAALADVDRSVRKRRAGELLETVGMNDWADKKVSTYSKGMMQRIGLAQALAADPDLVVLDEPTDGVDPVGRRDIQHVMARLREQNKTVFINSHQLSELEAICDRVAILVKGRVAKQGTIDELTVLDQRYEIELAAANPASLRPQILAALSVLPVNFVEKSPAASVVPPPMPPLPASTGPPVPHVLPPVPPSPLPYAAPYPMFGSPPGPRFAVDRGTLPTGEWIEVEGPLVRVGTFDPEPVQDVLDALRAARFHVRRVQPVRQSLEDLFMQAVIDPVSGRSVTPGAGPAAAGAFGAGAWGANAAGGDR